MVLVDTSVWIRFLANRGPYASALDALLARDEVVGHELIYGELLIGDRGGRREFLSSYEQMHQVAVIPHGEVVAFVHDRHLGGRGIGWVDVHLLASALVSGTKLWTADARFAAVVRDFGAGYDTFIT